ncbi:MAG: hypothetical protein LUD00_05515 [Prevotellaceae bacterium]|nr:hypothetical protein [Prevotellaceae bacterium]
MTSTQLYSSFCDFIDAQIFSEDNMGISVSFVVDKALITEFCKKNGVTEGLLMDAVRANLYPYRIDIKHIKGILAIQLYAASKRANSDGITVKNYRDRLSQVLDWDINDLQRWMTDYQEQYWESFYTWCDTHYFFVAKCKKKTGAGRYVQYPLMQSLCVFTEEDMKYIACAFVDSNLYPGEDVSEEDFWRNISKIGIKRYFRTKHSRDVGENSRTEDDYLRQIFNFYLRWNGEYIIENSKLKKQKGTDKDEFLYLNEYYSQLQIRNSRLPLLKRFDVAKLKYEDITRVFNFKHKGLILFKKDDVYDGYWQETRYIETGEEGVAIVFNKHCKHRIMRKTELLVKKYANVSIYIIKESEATYDFYTQKRFYSLQGGLKIGRLTYVYGAGPKLILTKRSRLWVDGKPMEPSTPNEEIELSNLDIGIHTIRFPNFKKIEFEVVMPKADSPKWLEEYNKWTINKENNLWNSERQQEGIVGLDFTSIPQNLKETTNGSVLERWGKMHLLGIKQADENNIAIKVLSNIR